MESAILVNDAYELRHYFKDHPELVDVLFEGMHPVAYALHLHQEKTDVELLKLLIQHSTIQSLMRLDSDGDSLFSFVSVIPKDEDLHSIMKRLRRSGYDFDRLYGANNATDLDVYLSTCFQDKRPVYEPILRLLAADNVLRGNRDYILYVASILPMRDMKLVVSQFIDRGIDITPVVQIMETIVKKANDHVLERLRYFADLGVKPHPDILKVVCKWNRMSLSILNFLLKHGVSTSKEVLSRCLFHIVTDSPMPDPELVRRLCDLGADPSFQKKSGQDALSRVIAGRNDKLTSVLLPYTPATRVGEAMKEKTDAKTKGVIRDYNRTMKYLLRATKIRQTNRSVRDGTIHKEIVSMKPDTFKQLLSYMKK